jgi:hypothetical protein
MHRSDAVMWWQGREWSFGTALNGASDTKYRFLADRSESIELMIQDQYL